jgi:transposase
MRDLEQARDDAKNVERSARHQLGKFLLRHGRIYQGKTAWSFDWIRKQAFEHEAQQRVLTDYLRTVEQAAERVEQLTRDMEELVKSWSLAPLVKALQALRGVQLVTAVVIAAELGDLSRFKSAPQLMAYLKPRALGTLQRRQQATGTHHANRQQPRETVANPRISG